MSKKSEQDLGMDRWNSGHGGIGVWAERRDCQTGIGIDLSR